MKNYNASLYYGKDYWFNTVESLKNAKDINKTGLKTYGNLYKEIIKQKKNGTILDVGCGSGLFLSYFKKKGWNVFGTEISKEISKFSSEMFGIKPLIGDLLNLKLSENYFDVITINNVLEHLSQPNETLLKIKSLLKDDGILEITVPNIESLGAKIFGNDWYHLDPGRHLFHFFPAKLEEMLKKTGFKIFKTSHSYFIHNYAGIFESLRTKYSPKYSSKSARAANGEKETYQFELKKLLAKTFAFLISAIEPILQRGEVITVYAKKES